MEKFPNKYRDGGKHTEEIKSKDQTKEASEGIEGLIDSAFELILKDPLVGFFLGGIGNVTAKPNGSTIGFETYYYDKTQEKLLPTNVLLLDNCNTKEAAIERKEDANSIISFYRVPFRGSSDSKYVTDGRAGTHMTGALYVSKERLKTLPLALQGALTQEDTRFHIGLFMKCGQAFAPDYYNEVIRLYKAELEANRR